MESFDKKYAIICDCSDKLVRVSTAKFDDSLMVCLQENTGHGYAPGIWGYVDDKGNEIIPPQFIYAGDFNKESAFVAKGKWEKRKEWNDRFWTDKELWGMIDKTGNEVIPCKFDQFCSFIYTGKEELEHCFEQHRESSYIMAHYGGWEKGKWGILDYNGNWVLDPVYPKFDYWIFDDDLVIFHNDEGFEEPDLGIYSIKQKRILYEPQFYDVIFKDGSIKVEKYDKETKKTTVEYLYGKAKKNPKDVLW